MSADRAAVERELREAWDDIAGLVESLPEEELVRPGVVEEWSVKDLLGHMAFWAHKAAEDLRALAAGRVEEIRAPTSEAEVNEWNRRESELREGRPLAAVKDEWRESFRAAAAALAPLPVDKLDIEVRGFSMQHRFAEDTYRHYREHAEQIRAWRREMETTET